MSSALATKPTPMMLQWQECKKEAKSALLLFRLGDFYEAFYEDAKIIADQLELTLTKRQGTPMCGVPYHSAEGYIDKLIAKGFTVAIAEQIEDPREVKGIVKRKVVRVLSPGTHLSANLLDEKSNNYLICVCKLASTYALAALDLTTSAFTTFETTDRDHLFEELYRLRPAELLIAEKCHRDIEPLLEDLQRHLSFVTKVREEWLFDHRTCLDFLLRHFGVQTLDGFGLKGKCAAINAAGSLLCYVQDELHQSISHINTLHIDDRSSTMTIDPTTQTHLELLEKSHPHSTTLLELLDETQTPMGGRLLRNWISRPLLCSSAIERRQNAITTFIEHTQIREELLSSLQPIRDLERLATRVSHNIASPRDLLSLALSLSAIPKIRTILSSLTNPLLVERSAELIDLSPLFTTLLQALVDTPPLRITDADVIREGYCEKLDELRILKSNAKAWLAEYQTKLRDTLGIKTLKVSFTKAFGYYIEVSRAQAEKMPTTFHKRQTLVSSERFLSPELKEFEEKILTAEEQILSLQQKLFDELIAKTNAQLDPIKQTAKAVAAIDTLLSLAVVALKRDYTCPTVDESDTFTVVKGRHPIVEAALDHGEFISNDVHFDRDERLWLITGPNMAGKSTFLRQVALLSILAQIGSYVPAQKAHIGIIDRVFTRIGASDDLASGKSTFMVEMSETANILHNATDRSLVILDEIGRGTSTYDGIAIAWAVAEHLLTAQRPKTLFATHYWELNELEEIVPGAVNYNVAVDETDGKVTFLHKIVRGGTDKSYGIHVARLAGIPSSALSIAKRKLRNMEKQTPSKTSCSQLDLFAAPTPVDESLEEIAQELKELDPNQLTPMQALEQLFELKQKLRR